MPKIFLVTVHCLPRFITLSCAETKQMLFLQAQHQKKNAWLHFFKHVLFIETYFLGGICPLSVCSEIQTCFTQNRYCHILKIRPYAFNADE